ncbi:peroxiredoxin-like family protein [Bradyrhizobium genosp. P]|uniref:peroxiredoxin-like family protein n=1 Tax=Bradyrhizobium genosp. P TaxID=83641 RepID=UPI003CF84EF4
MMILQDKLDAFTASLIDSRAISKNIIDTLQHETAELVASKKAEQALKAGQPAPSFRLKDSEGNVIDSAKLLAAGPLVVTFYRGVWCPYCNIELKALEEARSGIEARGASLVAISMQNAVNSRRSARENGLGFPILVDRHGIVAEEFGLRFTLTPPVVKIYRDILRNDLEAFNDDRSWSLPMPARFVIAQDGVVAYAEVNPDYLRRPDPSELVPVLDQLARARAA